MEDEERPWAMRVVARSLWESDTHERARAGRAPATASASSASSASRTSVDLEGAGAERRRSLLGGDSAYGPLKDDGRGAVAGGGSGGGGGGLGSREGNADGAPLGTQRLRDVNATIPARCVVAILGACRRPNDRPPWLTLTNPPVLPPSLTRA